MNVKDQNWTIIIKVPFRKKKEIEIYGKNMEWSENGFRKRICSLVLTVNGKTFQEEARDYFEAFCKIREQLAKNKIIAYCYGADLYSFPSSMSRDMSAGLVVSRVKIGEPSKRENVFHIFDFAKNLSPASVVDQENFYKSWIESLKRM